MKKQYTVKELASLSGVSVRTLHHYDDVGLLSPATRSDSGYRLYGQKELLRLQQILFYKELEVPLKEISRIIDDPEFDEKEALLNHKVALRKRKDRLDNLILTIDKTIHKMEGDDMVTDKELYAGFSEEQIKRYEQEIVESYGENVFQTSQKNIKKMSKQQWASLKTDEENICKKMASFMSSGTQVDDINVQEVVKQHHSWIENFYPAGKEVYSGLADLYASHPGFQKHYEKHEKGLSDYMKAAMLRYSENL